MTKQQQRLNKGEALLDYLLLYQSCWTNPILEDLSTPNMLLGGFTTQNTDSEWSDARQSSFGSIILDYYRATGNVEYLERGVAALRAQFPVSPYENWAHNGYTTKWVSSFHWGTGSGMAGVEIENDYLGDVVVDIKNGVAVGINGIDVQSCTAADDRIELHFTTPFQWKSDPIVVCHHATNVSMYRLSVNGHDYGSHTTQQLAVGVPVKRL